MCNILSNVTIYLYRFQWFSLRPRLKHKANGLLGGRMSGQRSGQLLAPRMENYPSRRMNHKLTNGTEMLKGNRNTTTLLFFPKGLKILHEERRRLPRLHGTTLKLYKPYMTFSRLSMASVDGKQHLSELVFSALLGCSL